MNTNKENINGARPDTRPSIAIDISILVLANILWGSTDVVAKFALAEMSPEALLWTRLTIALVAFAPVLWIRRSEIPRTLNGVLLIFGLGLCGFVVNFVLQYNGLKYAPASHATALRVSEALVIVLLSGLILREKIGRGTVVGLIVGTAGVVLVLDIDFKDLGLFTTGSRFGDLLILSGIFIESMYTIIGKQVLKTVSPLMATALACLTGWVMLSISYGVPVAREFSSGLPSAGALLACVYLGLMATVLSYWMYYKVLARRSSHRVGISIMIQPLVGIPLAALIFHDKMTTGFVLGAGCIMIGVYLALSRRD